MTQIPEVRIGSAWNRAWGTVLSLALERPQRVRNLPLKSVAGKPVTTVDEANSLN
jgi:hypothetical protein